MVNGTADTGYLHSFSARRFSARGGYIFQVFLGLVSAPRTLRLLIPGANHGRLDGRLRCLAADIFHQGETPAVDFHPELTH